MLTLPPEFKVTSDYDSHRPLLWLVLSRVGETVIELGMGNGSTPSLYWLCIAQQRQFFSYESDPEWYGKFDKLRNCYFISDYAKVKRKKCGVLFVDNAPGERRKEDIHKWRNYAKVIVVHDTEPGAEYVYGMSKILSTFKYKITLKSSGKYPQTTAVSNNFDLHQLRGTKFPGGFYIAIE